MRKPENLGIIVFLGFLVLCLCTFVFYLALQLFIKDGQFKHQEREANKAAIAMRDEREKLEKLLTKIRDLEKESKND